MHCAKCLNQLEQLELYRLGEVTIHTITLNHAGREKLKQLVRGSEAEKLNFVCPHCGTHLTDFSLRRYTR